MKKFLLLLTIILSVYGKSSAQTKPLPPPLPTREVSGVVKDEKGETLPGALITLKSAVDTIKTSTNEDGVFVIRDVKRATFSLTVSSIGSVTFIKKYLNSDIAKKIVLDPITLKDETNQLNEVKINGTPSVTYKTDTVEYRASDYKVRANSTIDELLKKMEGMEVGSDGSLIHQGEAVVRAKLNGKEFAGGSVAQAIKNLPADIVEKIQIVDDYGEQAARTGIKTGLPEKILNITTKPDRSVGITGRTTDQYGNNGRYNANLSVERIDGNQVMSVIGNAKSTVDGIGGGNPGTTDSGSPSVSYRDQLSKKVQVNTSYGYWYSNNNSINHQFGNFVTAKSDSLFGGPQYFDQQGSNTSTSNGQNGHFQIDIQADSLNFVQVNPSFGVSNSSSSNNYQRNEIDDYSNSEGVTNFRHVFSGGVSSNTNSGKNYGTSALYVHLFRKPKRNISVNFNVSHSDNSSNSNTNKYYRYYADSTLNNHLPLEDSTVHLLINRHNENTSVSSSATYTEPLSLVSLLEFSGSWSNSANSAISTQTEVDPLGNLIPRPDLGNQYNFSITQSRYTANYRLDGKKVNMSIGATAIDYQLTGTKLNDNTFENASTSRHSFKVIPAFRFSYSWSRTQRIQLNYNGANIDPDFSQIQPFTDRSNPLNVIVGNPNLDPGFNHSLNGSYNNYLANSRFNISLNGYLNLYTHKIATNNLRLQIPTDPKNYYTLVQYLNLDGSYAWGTGYSISKQLDDRRYNLALNGSVNYNHATAEENNQVFHQDTWSFDNRFGPRINPNDNIEVNPYVGYTLTRGFSSIDEALGTQYSTARLAIDGKFYFKQTYQINYSASKNFVSGVKNSTNPFVVNMGFQKEFLEKRNLVFTFDVFDVFHQNNFILQQPIAGGQISTISNTNSRYFLVGLRLNLQKWGGRPQQNGKNMQRRGDGSFIYQ
ncbi:outer membrane beta-barrel protein [Mucilaginibacter sp. dw_454]|uniref:outer membrane beta-barrel protein n=1 Tax=Mucilaginibacter sp. dw_454 TaxID=2720079 RepID=UPI001BD62DE1|nr:outer membrane beta-barrel protein [Mucilaginibacter sp. dw_454]